MQDGRRKKRELFPSWNSIIEFSSPLDLNHSKASCLQELAVLCCCSFFPFCLHQHIHGIQLGLYRPTFIFIQKWFNQQHSTTWGSEQKENTPWAMRSSLFTYFSITEDNERPKASEHVLLCRYWCPRAEEGAITGIEISHFPQLKLIGPYWFCSEDDSVSSAFKAPRVQCNA